MEEEGNRRITRDTDMGEDWLKSKEIILTEAEKACGKTKVSAKARTSEREEKAMEKVYTNKRAKEGRKCFRTIKNIRNTQKTKWKYIQDKRGSSYVTS